MPKTEDTYYPPVTLHYPGATVRVYRPILTDAERARRMKIIHDAAADLLKSIQK